MKLKKHHYLHLSRIFMLLAGAIFFLNQKLDTKADYTNDIINTYFGSGSEYTTNRTGAGCNIGSMQVVNISGNIELNNILDGNGGYLSSNTIYILEEGDYILNYSMELSSCVAIIGSGYVRLSADDPTINDRGLINMNPSNHIIVDNIKIDGKNIDGGNRDGIQIYNTNNITLNSVKIYNFDGGGNGLSISRSNNTSLSGVRVYNAGGLSIRSSSGVYINNSKFFKNSYGGLSSSSVTGIHIDNVQIFSNYNSASDNSYIKYSSFNNIQIYDNAGVGFNCLLCDNNTYNYIQSYNNGSSTTDNWGHGMRDYRGKNNTYNNIQTFNNTANGLRIIASTGLVYNNIQTYNNRSAGFYIDGLSVSNTLNNVVVYNNLGDGLFVRSNAYENKINNIMSYNNNGANVSFGGSTNKVYGNLFVVGAMPTIYKGLSSDYPGIFLEGYVTTGEMSCDIVNDPTTLFSVNLQFGYSSCDLIGRLETLSGGVISYNYGSNIPLQTQPLKDIGVGGISSYATSNLSYNSSNYVALATNSICGDGIIGSVELCDDGNTISGDGCSNLCQIETRLTGCTSIPANSIYNNTSTIIQTYIDGKWMPSEISSYNTFAVSTECRFTCSNTGYTYLGGTCQKIPVCGDNEIDFGETCDDGNLIDNDGCSSSCLIEADTDSDGIPDTIDNCPYVANPGQEDSDILVFQKTNYSTGEDCIEEDVCLTRRDSLPVYNNKTIEWACGECGSETSDYYPELMNLYQYDSRNGCVQGFGNTFNNTGGFPTCLHIKDTDSYWDISWFQWTQGGAGGGFSYNRSGNGMTGTFVKADYSTGEHCIEEDVCLTRRDSLPVYNNRDVEWACGECGSETSDYYPELMNLYQYDSRNGCVQLFGNTFNNTGGFPTCLHIKDTDSYWDISWTQRTQGGVGGGFTYTRKSVNVGGVYGSGDACDCSDLICTEGTDYTGNLVCDPDPACLSVDIKSYFSGYENDGSGSRLNVTLNQFKFGDGRKSIVNLDTTYELIMNIKNTLGRATTQDDVLQLPGGFRYHIGSGLENDSTGSVQLKVKYFNK